MEIIYTGPLTGAEAFSVTSSESSLSCSTNYCYAKDTQLYTVDLPIDGEWKPYRFTLGMRGRGVIQVRLRGPHKLNDYGEIYSIATDYKNLRIADKVIFPARRKVTYTKDFEHRISVNANDTVKISFDVRKHPLGADDFNLIRSKNFWYVITLSILAFAIFYTLLQRISTTFCKRRKPEDGVFLFIFFLLLAAPLCNVFGAQKMVSLRENRALAKCPRLSEVLIKGANFGRGFESWFCDHLSGREGLLKIHDVINMQTQHIIKSPQTWQMLDNGWIFYLPLTPRADMKQVQPIVTNLVRLQKFCEINHIKLYVLVVPRKESIYQEHLYGYGRSKENGVSENAFHEQIKQLTRKQHISYIYPWKELRDASRQDYTYFKVTHHWTDWGAYIGYRALMNEIRKDFPNMPIVSLGNYRQTQSKLIRDDWERDYYIPSHSWSVLNSEIDRCQSAPVYNYYDHKHGNELALKMGNDKYMKDFTYGGGAYRIMLFGDSQSENFTGFLSYSASKMRLVRFNLETRGIRGRERYKILKHHANEILSYKPDILVLLVWLDALFGFSHPW